MAGPPAEMAVVFQEYGRSLFPWKTVRENIELPLREKKIAKAERTRLVDEALAAVALAGAGDSYPWQLSGGMQQRVAIARAVAYQPKVMVLDEPFAAVDAQTRADLEDLMLRLWTELDLTVIFVTHDIDEAVYLGHRVLVLLIVADAHPRRCSRRYTGAAQPGHDADRTPIRRIADADLPGNPGGQVGGPRDQPAHQGLGEPPDRVAMEASAETLLQHGQQMAHGRSLDPVFRDQRLHPEFRHGIIGQQGHEIAAFQARLDDMTRDPRDAHARHRGAEQELAVIGTQFWP